MRKALVPSLIAAGLLGVTLFLLAADLLHVTVSGHKIKYGYFLVAALWLTAPREMIAATLRIRAPRWPLLIAVPIAVAVATSADVTGSLWWGAWLGFDVFTVVTVYAFLQAHHLAEREVALAAVLALALIALGGLAQFIAIYFLDAVVLSPQKHFELYRINGLAGWPHFLCIFSFLLLPLALTQDRISWPAKAALAILVFVLVQSTAKTGWVLFLALGAFMLWFDRQTFTRNFLLFLLPLTVAALLLPTPSSVRGSEPISGSAKLHVFAEDLDLSRATTSGSDRVLINLMGLAVFAKHPWFGVGPRAYDTYVFTRFDRELPGVNNRDGNGNVNAKNENIWIEWLAEAGIFVTLGFAAILLRALWTPGFAFRNALHFGSWTALVLYFGLSGQVSQNGLLTMAYAVLGIYFHARELPHVAKWSVLTRSRAPLLHQSVAPLASTTRPRT